MVIPEYFTKKTLPYWVILIIDSLTVIVAGLIATYVVQGGSSLARHFWDHVLMWLAAVPLFMIGMRIFHTYSGIIRYTTTIEFMRVLQSVALGGILMAICFGIVDSNFPQSFMAEHLRWLTIGLMLAMTLVVQWGMRIVIKYTYEALFMGHRRIGAFVYGAHEGAIAIARSFRDADSKYVLRGFISNDSVLESKYLMGRKVYMDGPNTVRIIVDSGAKVLIVSPLQQEKFRDKTELQNALIKAGIRILIVPNAEEWDTTKEIRPTQLREVDIEDLLPREKIEVDMPAIGAMLCGKRILITGAAGSIGSEMVRQVARYDPLHLVLIDQAETPMHDIRLFMQNKYPEIPCETVVGNISNATHMEQLFSKYKPEYVFHAAAYKHVPMMENNPAIAVQNNIYGTRVVADLAVKYGTKKFVMISTDKAVNPTNVMGCSKRICEIYCQSLNKAKENKQTQFITTRFGNVLGSNGSVIPLFREQIRKGGPITVTHPDIIRYFMLIPEACQLVLEAGTMGNGGEIFVFDMGKPVRIANLAQRMIDLSGAQDVKIVFTGLRDGEKLYEEVLNDAELTKPTNHPKIRVAAVRECDYKEALKNEKELYELSLGYDDMAIVKKMKEIVPEYRSQHSKYEVLDK